MPDSYKDLKHKSDSLLKQISENLQQLSIEPLASMEAKISAIHQNEKTLKQQYSNLTKNDFVGFQKKLIVLNRAVSRFSGDESKGRPSYSMKGDNLALIKNVFKNSQLGPKIDHIQYFAEKVDQRIRVLETTRKLLQENKH